MRWTRQELTYCSNVHPGASLAKVSQNTSQYISAVANQRTALPMAAGLWFSNDCINQLTEPTTRDSFFAQLKQQGLYIGTLNGFPYGDFHQPVVKQKVYLPTWAETARLDYTVKLAHLLSQVKNSNLKELSISTLPLGYTQGWQENLHRQACVNLCKLAKHLQQIESDTGQHIRVCLEMEPDCVLESTHQLINFFNHDLEQTASQLNIDATLIYRYLGCCYDTCHQAVMHESTFDSMLAISQAGIGIGKIQISNAPVATLKDGEQLRELIEMFYEPKFLHQVKIKTPNGMVSLPDLPHLAEGNHKTVSDSHLDQYFDYPWHIHFHIPIYLSTLKKPFLSTTQKSILDVLRFLSSSQNDLPAKPFLEIETYTWAQFNQKRMSQDNQFDSEEELLHNSEKKNDKPFKLIDGITDEFSWLEQQLETFNLLEQATPAPLHS